jgi:trans-aconitate methyltransferase
MADSIEPQQPWGDACALQYETGVVPRYMARFGEVLLELVVASEDARIGHMGCRTGYPAAELLARLPGAHLHGWDQSWAAIELARTKPAPQGAHLDYASRERLDFPPGAFSHFVWMHPQIPWTVVTRTGGVRSVCDTHFAALQNSFQLLASGGQLLLALPLQGSFVELFDLLREYALKYDDHAMMNRVDEIASRFPSADELAQALTSAGFEYIESVVRPTELVFPNARALFDDPAFQLMVRAEIHPVSSHGPAMAYLERAIDRYFSESEVTLSILVGALSARKPLRLR